MNKAKPFLIGSLLGGALCYLALQYHLVRSHDGFIIVPRTPQHSPGLAIVDIRGWDADAWSDRPALARALIAHGSGDLIAASVADNLANQVTGDHLTMDRLRGFLDEDTETSAPSAGSGSGFPVFSNDGDAAAPIPFPDSARKTEDRIAHSTPRDTVRDVGSFLPRDEDRSDSTSAFNDGFGGFETDDQANAWDQRNSVTSRESGNDRFSNGRAQASGGAESSTYDTYKNPGTARSDHSFGTGSATDTFGGRSQFDAGLANNNRSDNSRYPDNSGVNNNDSEQSYSRPGRSLDRSDSSTGSTSGYGYGNSSGYSSGSSDSSTFDRSDSSSNEPYGSPDTSFDSDSSAYRPYGYQEDTSSTASAGTTPFDQLNDSVQQIFGSDENNNGAFDDSASDNSAESSSSYNYGDDSSSAYGLSEDESIPPGASLSFEPGLTESGGSDDVAPFGSITDTLHARAKEAMDRARASMQETARRETNSAVDSAERYVRDAVTNRFGSADSSTRPALQDSSIFRAVEEGFDPFLGGR